MKEEGVLKTRNKIVPAVFQRRKKERRIMSKITEPWVQAVHAVTY